MLLSASSTSEMIAESVSPEWLNSLELELELELELGSEKEKVSKEGSVAKGSEGEGSGKGFWGRRRLWRTSVRSFNFYFK